MRACAFDELASTYDATFTDTRVGRALREIVWSRFEAVFGASRNVLELGCGTGEDAVRLAGTGAQVTAIDASSKMIHVGRAKALQAGCAQRIEFRCLPMQEVRSLPDTARFDGVLSNFGAINCVPNVPALVADLAARLTPGAPLLWVVMGRYAPWEWGWHLASGKWHKAWRRLHPGGIDWRGLTIFYPTPASLRALLQPHFKVTRLAPLGVVLPPSYAGAWLERAPRALATLVRLEKVAQRAGFLAWLSDHFIVEAVRQ